MNRNLLLASVTLLSALGCQSSCPTACAPGQKPPLGQRLFGTTQKPTNCPTCPTPGALPGPQPAFVGAPSPVPVSPPSIGTAIPASPPPSMSPPVGMTGPALGLAPPPAPVTTNKVVVPPNVALGPPETTQSSSQSNRSSAQTGFPVDIPNYAILSEKIAGGHQPFPDGITWLKEAGFSTVIHLRSNTDDVVASRQLVERNGLAYKSFEVSAQSFDSALLTALDRDIQAANGRPVFIFDRDGTRTGAVWIAYAIGFLAMPESQAREHATRLGYRKDTADPAWESAISNYLKTR